MTTEAFLLENAGAVNHARGFRRLLRAQYHGLAGVPALGTDLVVSQRGAGANMSVDVTAGTAIIASSSATHGFYGLYSDAVTNVAITASNPSNPRIDIIIAQALDTEQGDGFNLYQVGVITGTPAGSPTVPSPPARSLVLAQVAVAANATSIVNANITDKRLPAGLAQTAALLQITSTQTFANNTANIENFDTKVYDYGGNATTGASATYTVPSTGVYQADSVVNFGFNNPEQRALLTIYRNGAELARLADNSWISFGTNHQLSVSGSLKFALTAADAITWRFDPIGVGNTNAVQVFSAFGSIMRVG